MHQGAGCKIYCNSVGVFTPPTCAKHMPRLYIHPGNICFVHPRHCLQTDVMYLEVGLQQLYATAAIGLSYHSAKSSLP